MVKTEDARQVRLWQRPGDNADCGNDIKSPSKKGDPEWPNEPSEEGKGRFSRWE